MVSLCVYLWFGEGDVLAALVSTRGGGRRVDLFCAPLFSGGGRGLSYGEYVE